MRDLQSSDNFQQLSFTQEEIKEDQNTEKYKDLVTQIKSLDIDTISPIE